MKELTIADVNVRQGGWLHSFEWMDIYPIGDIDEEWNWLDGTSPEDLPPKNIHFTTGGPIYPEWKGKRDIDNQYADEWRDFFSTVVKG